MLIIRCERCHCGIRVPQLSVCAPFAPTVCTRCGESLLGARYRTALPEVTRLQDALLKGKREGSAEIAGLGTFTWQEIVALADVILGGFWTATILEERESILLKYQYETLENPRSATRLYDCRHDSLLFLAWLIDGWPKSLGASVGREMLWRGLNRPRNRLSHHVLPRWKGHPWNPSPHDFGPEIIARLHKLLEL